MAVPRNQESELRKKTFDHESIDIHKKYGKELPPPSPELRISVVVPSSAEVSNDNFWRMLRSFLLQKNFNPKKFEILFVINNPQVAVDAASGKTLTHEDLDDIHQQAKLSAKKLEQRYLENQNHLEILKLIDAGQKMIAAGHSEASIKQAIQAKLQLQAFKLSKYEEELFFQAVKKGIRIHGIDASSNQKALHATLETNPVALSRHIGGHIAYQRLSQTKGSVGLIDFLDADCFVTPQYINSLINRKDAPDYVIKPMHSVITEIPKSVKSTNQLQQFFTIAKYLRDHYNSFPFDYPAKSIITEFSLGGPQIAITADAFRSANGYSLSKRDADFSFSYKLKEYNFTNKVIAAAQVYVADREREGSVDGNLRVKGHTDNIQAVLKIQPNTTRIEDALKKNAYLDASPRYQQEYRKLRKDRFRKESLTRIFTLKQVERVLEFLFKKYEKTQSTNATDYLTPNFFNPQEKFFNSREIDYLQQNIVLVEAVLALFKLMESDPLAIAQFIGLDPKKDNTPKSKVALLVLQTMIPEHFAPPPKNEPDYVDILHTIQAQGLQQAGQNLNSHDFIHLNMALNDFIETHPDMKRQIAY